MHSLNANISEGGGLNNMWISVQDDSPQLSFLGIFQKSVSFRSQTCYTVHLVNSCHPKVQPAEFKVIKLLNVHWLYRTENNIKLQLQGDSADLYTSFPFIKQDHTSITELYNLWPNHRVSMCLRMQNRSSILKQMLAAIIRKNKSFFTMNTRK